MPTARGALAAAVLDGRIHAVSGVGSARKNTPAHEAYDPATNQWTRRTPVPTPRDHHAAVAAGGRLFAIGGRVDGSYSRNLAINESYDPATDKWETRAALPTARSGIAGVLLQERIVVVGGEAPSGTFNQVEIYDVAADRWSTAAPMPTARHGLGAAVVGNRLFVIAGGPTPGASASAANEIFAPSP